MRLSPRKSFAVCYFACFKNKTFFLSLFLHQNLVLRAAPQEEVVSTVCRSWICGIVHVRERRPTRRDDGKQTIRGQEKLKRHSRWPVFETWQTNKQRRKRQRCLSGFSWFVFQTCPKHSSDAFSCLGQKRLFRTHHIQDHFERRSSLLKNTANQTKTIKDDKKTSSTRGFGRISFGERGMRLRARGSTCCLKISTLRSNAHKMPSLSSGKSTVLSKKQCPRGSMMSCCWPSAPTLELN
jgi:hypothetical protein